MNSEYLKDFARLAIFIGGGGLILLFFEPRQSAEWVLSLCSAAIGVVMLAGVIFLSRGHIK